MENKIIEQKKNPFLSREEIIMEIINDRTPTKEEVLTALGKDSELIVIKKITNQFGKQKFLAKIVVYDSLEDKEKIETVPQKVRKKLEAEKKKAEEEAKKAQEEAKKAEEEAKKAEEEKANEEIVKENTEEKSE